MTDVLSCFACVNCIKHQFESSIILLPTSSSSMAGIEENQKKKSMKIKTYNAK